MLPAFTTKVKGGLLTARGLLQPTDLNRVYRVRIEYRLRNAPKVFVEDPPLCRRAPDEPIPHTYEGVRPCLYHPEGFEFTASDDLASTIVPWLSLWLFFYESWLATGVWHGEGVHPGDGEVEGRAG